LVKEQDVEVEWKSFELRPEGVEPLPRHPGYMEQVMAGIERLSQAYNLEMNYNKNSKHSRKALEGAKFAKDHGLENQYHQAVFEAQFQQDADIDNLDQLLSIVERVGLDVDQFRTAIAERKYRNAVLQDIEEAAYKGITAIPAFIIGDEVRVGAQSYEVLRDLVNKA
jgi:predicted DsbA family dithiol-disulfide isomerase